jgi:tRNA (guanine-N7-)-methyltransferase
MGKDKLKRFAENETFERMFQPDIDYHSTDHELKGKWNERVFRNNNPIVLELGCGRGEYTVGLAQHYPEKNFVGIDIKGARIWRGAKTINEQNILNAAFLRIRMEIILKFFAPNEVSEIWVTFPDPQPRDGKENKRLTSPLFMERYAQFLKPGGIIHLKTDNFQLYEFSKSAAITANKKIIDATDNLYASDDTHIDLSIQTTYEKIYLKEGKPICYLSYQL